MKISAKNRANSSTSTGAPTPSPDGGKFDAERSTIPSPMATVASEAVESTFSKSILSLPSEVGVPDRSPADVVDHAEGVLRRIDPNRIRVMGVPNRDASSFESDEFEELHQNILAAGGNSVPISVMQLDVATDSHDYELIAGERRMRACLLANLPVLAIVKQALMVSERQRMLATIRENLARQNLSPYEFGRQLKFVIEAGLAPSARALGRDIGRHHSDISAAIKLASLPAAVIEAFASSAEIQYRFEGPLSLALTKNQEAVLKAAQDIRAMSDRPSGKKVVQLLVAAASALPDDVQPGGVGPSDTPSNGAVCYEGKEVGSVEIDRRGHAKIALAVVLTLKQQASLHKQIEAFVRRCLSGVGAVQGNSVGAPLVKGAEAVEPVRAESEVGQ